MNRKLVVGGVVAVAGIVALFAFSGTASASGRDPWTTPLEIPATEDEWKLVRTSICTCGRGGAEGKELLLCVLGKVYPDVPWASVVAAGPVDGDHPSLLAAIEQVGQLVLEYQSLGTEEEREQWCDFLVIGPVNPVSPNPIGPFNPAAPKPLGPFNPAKPNTPETPYEARKRRLGELKSDIARGGVLWKPTYQQFPDNQSDTARAMLQNEGIEATPGLVAALAGHLSCPQWNAPYKRKKDANDPVPSYFFCNGWRVGPAYLPRNADATFWILQGKKVPKTIKDNGAKKSGVQNATHFGLLWLPRFDADVARDNGTIIITEPEPPADFLAMLT